jgi:hypothetical protein
MHGVPLQAPLFPIDHPVMPEERQIGRASAIDDLERRIEGATHQWLIGPRRIGKTSVAKAALARRRAAGAVALDADLTKLKISGAEDLAGELARQARAAGVGVISPARRARRGAATVARQIAEIGRTVEDLGYQDESDAARGIAALLAGADDGQIGMRQLLDALIAHAVGSGRRVVVLLDEVHLVADLGDCEHELARAAREQDSPIVLVFAGSERSAVAALRSPPRPLAPVGQELHLPEITTAAWLPGLHERFTEAGIMIDRREILAIVEASDGHPRRTMLISNYVHTAATAERERTADQLLVGLAIRDAMADLAWK